VFSTLSASTSRSTPSSSKATPVEQEISSPAPRGLLPVSDTTDTFMNHCFTNGSPEMSIASSAVALKHISMRSTHEVGQCRPILLRMMLTNGASGQAEEGHPES